MADYSQFFPKSEGQADYSQFFPEGAPAGIKGPHQNISREQQLAEDRRVYSPTVGMSTADRFTAGAQKWLSDRVLGAQQLVSELAPTPLGTPTVGPTIQQRVDETKRLDQPLMDTAAGTAGNVIGGAVMSAPMLGLPGANTLPGAAAMGLIQGAMEPVATGGPSRLTNTAIGAVSQLGGQLTGMGLNRIAQNRVANLATQQGQNTVRDATLADSRNAGYVLPPSAVQPGFFTNRMESVAGKAALGQEASHRNQEVTNNLVRQTLGIPQNQAISQNALEGIRRTEGRVYGEVAALNQNAADALLELRRARNTANEQFRFYQRSANPDALTAARQATNDAATWEHFLEQEAAQAGRQDLIPALRAARQRIAQTYTVERALNTSTGDVDARTLARAVDRGDPLTGGLETAGRFADAFPRYAASGAPTAGVSKLESGASALLGLAGASALGPWGTAMAALPLLSPAVRAGVLSGPGQNLLSGIPNYNPGMLTRALANPAQPALLGIGAPQLGILALQ